MKIAIAIFSLLVTTSAFAAYPFTISGDKISAIFQSEILWRKLGGAAETIVFKGHTGNTSRYALTTTESVPVKGRDGVTRFQPTPCLVLVDVTGSGDEMAPLWKVTAADFSACPGTTGK